MTEPQMVWHQYYECRSAIECLAAIAGALQPERRKEFDATAEGALQHARDFRDELLERDVSS